MNTVLNTSILQHVHQILLRELLHVLQGHVLALKVVGKLSEVKTDGGQPMSNFFPISQATVVCVSFQSSQLSLEPLPHDSILHVKIILHASVCQSQENVTINPNLVEDVNKVSK